MRRKEEVQGEMEVHKTCRERRGLAVSSAASHRNNEGDYDSLIS